jgi:hypothetical protein
VARGKETVVLLELALGGTAPAAAGRNGSRRAATMASASNERERDTGIDGTLDGAEILVGDGEGGDGD